MRCTQCGTTALIDEDHPVCITCEYINNMVPSGVNPSDWICTRCGEYEVIELGHRLCINCIVDDILLEQEADEAEQPNDGEVANER